MPFDSNGDSVHCMPTFAATEARLVFPGNENWHASGSTFLMGAIWWALTWRESWETVTCDIHSPLTHTQGGAIISTTQGGATINSDCIFKDILENDFILFLGGREEEAGIKINIDMLSPSHPLLGIHWVCALMWNQTREISLRSLPGRELVPVLLLKQLLYYFPHQQL